MSIDASSIIDALASHAMSLGIFERVNQHEPKNSPGNGISAAVWLDAIGPVPRGSGLSATTARLAFNVRIYQNMLSEPQDAIDPAVIKAVDSLFTAYSADFELGGDVAYLDLLGQAGVALQAQAGYINIDGKHMRVLTIVVPVVLNDAWPQVA